MSSGASGIGAAALRYVANGVDRGHSSGKQPLNLGQERSRWLSPHDMTRIISIPLLLPPGE